MAGLSLVGWDEAAARLGVTPRQIRELTEVNTRNEVRTSPMTTSFVVVGMVSITSRFHFPYGSQTSNRHNGHTPLFPYPMK